MKLQFCNFQFQILGRIPVLDMIRSPLLFIFIIFYFPKKQPEGIRQKRMPSSNLSINFLHISFAFIFHLEFFSLRLSSIQQTNVFAVLCSLKGNFRDVAVSLFSSFLVGLSQCGDSEHSPAVRCNS